MQGQHCSFCAVALRISCLISPGLRCVQPRSFPSALQYPVQERVAPRYYSIIKHPMCFTDMRRKLANDEYTTSRAFVADFELIINNARTYNTKQTKCHKCAVQLQRNVNKILKQHELDLRKAFQTLRPADIAVHLGFGPQAAESVAPQQALPPPHLQFQQQQQQRHSAAAARTTTSIPGVETSELTSERATGSIPPSPSRQSGAAPGITPHADVAVHVKFEPGLPGGSGTGAAPMSAYPSTAPPPPPLPPAPREPICPYISDNEDGEKQTQRPRAAAVQHLLPIEQVLLQLRVPVVHQPWPHLPHPPAAATTAAGAAAVQGMQAQPAAAPMLLLSPPPAQQQQQPPACSSIPDSAQGQPSEVAPGPASSQPATAAATAAAAAIPARAAEAAGPSAGEAGAGEAAQSAPQPAGPAGAAGAQSAAAGGSARKRAPPTTPSFEPSGRTAEWKAERRGIEWQCHWLEYRLRELAAQEHRIRQQLAGGTGGAEAQSGPAPGLFAAAGGSSAPIAAEVERQKAALAAAAARFTQGRPGVEAARGGSGAQGAATAAAQPAPTHQPLASTQLFVMRAGRAAVQAAAPPPSQQLPPRVGTEQANQAALPLPELPGAGAVQQLQPELPAALVPGAVYGGLELLEQQLAGLKRSLQVRGVWWVRVGDPCACTPCCL